MSVLKGAKIIFHKKFIVSRVPAWEAAVHALEYAARTKYINNYSIFSICTVAKKNYISASIIPLMQTELHTSDRFVLLVAHKWKGEMKQIQIIGSSTSDFTGFN